MPMWRCPHCGTPQAETARCWVCRRSSTSCGSCRHYRQAVAGKLGYCGLDRHRRPLAGDEIRPCWEAGPLAAEPPVAAPTVAARHVPPDQPSVPRRLEFVDIDTVGVPSPGAEAPMLAAGAPSPGAEAPILAVGASVTPHPTLAPELVGPPASATPSIDPPSSGPAGWTLWAEFEV